MKLSNSHIKLMCCSFWKASIHAGSYLSAVHIIQNTNFEVAEGLVQLMDQVHSDTMVPDMVKQIRQGERSS